MCTALIFLRALTPVHVGVGRGGEIVDLSIQRDEFGFPCIWSSSFKGSLRANITRVVDENEKPCVKVVFGPEPGSSEVSEYSSALSIVDAKLLLIPVRSLRGVWIYATSPHLLSYLDKYLEAVKGQSLSQLQNISIGVTSRSDIFVDGSKAVLNEELIELKVEQGLELKLFKDILPKELLDRVSRRGLVILDDDVMKALVNRSMLIQYRVRLKSETKTVEEGPWSEEYLPEETILVSAFVGRQVAKEVLDRTRCSMQSNVCSWVKQILASKLRGRIWLGGKETLGRGFMEIYVG